jgi:O-antigen ligase
LGLIVLSLRGPKVLKLIEANGAIVLFFAYCALSLTWADYPDVGFKRWVKAIGDFVMVLIVVTDRDPSAAVRRLLTRIGFLLIPTSVLLIRYYPELARVYDPWDWTTWYVGVTTSKNALGVTCMIFGLASVWQFLSALSSSHQPGRGRRLIAHGVMLVMVAWLLWLAKSMTSLACFGLATVMLLSLFAVQIVQPPARSARKEGGRANRKAGFANFLMMHAFVATLIAIPSVVLFVGIEGILEMMGKDATLTDRTVIWNLLLSMTPNVWFGVGFENFWLGSRLEKIWGLYSLQLNQAHNGYLEIYLNLGWVGIALLILVLLVGYQTVMTGLRRSSSTGNILLAFFMVGVVYNFTEAAFFRISAPAWFILLLAITKVPEVQSFRELSSLGRRPTGRVARVQLGGHGKVGEDAVAMSRKA